MSMTTALSNLFSLERQRARFRSDRLDNDHHSEDDDVENGNDDDDNAQRPPSSTESPTAVAAHQSSSSLSSRRSSVRNRSVRRSGVSATTITGLSSSGTPIAVGDSNAGQGLTIPRGTAPDTSNEPSPSSPTVVTRHNHLDPDDDDDEDALDVESPGGSSANSNGSSPESLGRIPILTTTTGAQRNTLTLAELEEERELARRRSSLCILLASFVLFRLWVSAIQEGDFGLMLLCLMGTSWTARWISYNREREEELDRRIAHYLEHGTSEGGNGTGDPTLERSELRMLSFQAQLALAIMESQRQMMQGGYGNPDGADQQPGVSDEARAKWKHIKFQATDSAAPPGNNQAGYGSVAQKDKDSELDGDGPHCSICLSEYEDGDSVVKLPCNHLYHDECISSWTSNHVKCPLCNYDLESSVGDSVSEIV